MTQAILTRYSSSVTIGTVITFGLLLLMQHLIATGETVFVDAPRFPMIKFVRVEEAVPPPVRKPPEEIQPPIEPPPRIITDRESNDTRITIVGPRPMEDHRTVIESGSGNMTGSALALVKVAPIYPETAVMRRIEGYVIVEYTITVAGSVTDVVVTESSNSIFNRASVNAARKFKYKPTVIDGEPVETLGARNRFTFELDD